MALWFPQGLSPVQDKRGGSEPARLLDPFLGEQDDTTMTMTAAQWVARGQPLEKETLATL